MEIPLCGHATLASSKVIFEKTELDEINFINIQDLDLPLQKEGHDIIMKFAVYDTQPAEAPKPLLDALGIDEICNGGYNNETNILLLEIENKGILKSLCLDFEALYHSHDSINGVSATVATGEDGYDLHSRYFRPWNGTNEDPVTGGTHTFLAKYCSDRLNKSKMKSFQPSASTGFMEVEIFEYSIVLIKSQAVIIFEGNVLH